jgi:thiosulfate/3-mercaptopyruvate sulfurtransferase
MGGFSMAQYAHPEVLVDTDWVKDRLDERGIRIVEVDVDTKAYDVGHIPGAVAFNWQSQLQDPVRRDIISQADFEKLMGQSGISPGDTVILYGDNNNWFAAYGFWLMKYYGHEDVRLMNGGRVKWLNEPDKPLTDAPTHVAPTTYKVARTHPELRAMLPEVLDITRADKANLIDVRSPDEFTGKVLAPPGLNETAQRGGHIPGASNVPWSTAVNAADGTFKPLEQLLDIYFKQSHLDPNKPTVAYCRIGERSSHTWFVLQYLLGIDNVKNYDGSWTEYGNLVGAPIER